MSNYTPGPWKFRGCGGGWAIDFNEDQEQVVDFVYEEADARLIAAAPDLLEACEAHINALRSKIRDGKYRQAYEDRVYEAEKKMLAAIAKARGTP